MPNVLRVRPVSDVMVPDYAALDIRLRRFHGWRHDPNHGAENGAFLFDEKTVVELPSNDKYTVEYIRHLRTGDLLPADEETARRAGVAFPAASE